VSTALDAAQRPSGRRRAWLAATVQWRNWPLLVKLGMVLVVPVVAALVLGVLRVRSDVELSESYADIERIATLRAGLVEVLSNIQHERNFAVQQAAGGSEAFDLQAGETDVIINDLNERVRLSPDLGEAATAGRAALTKTTASLKSMREQVKAGAEWFAVLSGYGSVINAVLDFDRALVGRFPDRELSGTSTALYDLQAAREQASLQQAIGLIGLRQGSFTEIQRDMLVEAGVRLDDKLTDGRVVAPPELWERYESIVSGPDVTTRSALVLAAKSQGTIAIPFSKNEWSSASDVTTSLMTNVARSAAADLQAASSRLQDSVSNRAGTQSVLLLLMVLLAAGIGGVLGRYLLRSVGLLRRTALDVAHNRLPAAVASIRAGEGSSVTIEPVPLRTTEEFGQLARAFDAVNGQAVRSAAEEAALRSNLRNIFVNLSRRSQGLVERQLRLMERLEQKENDPDQLSNLFKLDHLATRMRRNNENLMVLSGVDLARRSTEPMPLPDVLRAAVSEVEHYQRAIVRSAPMVRIVGYAAGDLVRSVAELVENATAFSPPDSQVVITSQRSEDGGVQIDIVDQGIGMGEAELADANLRVASGGNVDVPISRQMGLFVVGNLTNRHGIAVRLSRRGDGQGGLRASVLVPAALVALAVDTSASAGEQPTVVEPVEVEIERDITVTGRLESAGIFVRLPELPSASSPASILFAARIPVQPSTQLPVPANGSRPDRRPEFTWLDAPVPQERTPAPRPAMPVTAPVVERTGPGGLPKRVPQAQLMATASRGETTGRQPAVPRDAVRTRGFLSSFQSGIRQTEPKGEESP
jgi:signal transduction histidine kinase